MRIILALIMTITCLASIPASATAMFTGGVAALPSAGQRQARLAGEDPPAANPPAGQEIFLDGGFIYIPPALPSDSSDPRFYQQSFHVTPQVQAPPPSQESTSIPTALPTESPTIVPPAPTATPTPTQGIAPAVSEHETVRAVEPKAVSPEPSASSAFTVADPNENQGQFFDGGFVYIPPGPQPPDDPAFHRGTYSYSQESDKMSRVSEAATVIPMAPGISVPPAAEASAAPAHIEGIAHHVQPEAAPKRMPAPVEYDAPDEMQAASTTLSPSYYDRSPLPAEGKAMYYNPGIMQEVLEYRLSMGQVDYCPDCVGYVALLRVGDLNRRVWIEWPDGSVEGPFLVIDVAARHHVGMLLGRGWIIDVDYRTAMRHGMNRPLPVIVYDYPPFIQPYTTHQSNTQPQ